MAINEPCKQECHNCKDFVQPNIANPSGRCVFGRDIKTRQYPEHVKEEKSIKEILDNHFKE